MNRFIRILVSLIGRFVGRAAQLQALFMCYWRGVRTVNRASPGRFHVEGIELHEYEVEVDGYRHRVTEAGNSDAESGHTLVMMGGVPTDSSETFYWLAAELCKLNPAIRAVILHLPHTEMDNPVQPGDALAEHNGWALPFNDAVDFSRKHVDQRFDHRVQAQTAYRILINLHIPRAHFVGHDRGAVVFDYLLADQPEIAVSYSRGAQLWDFYDEDWAHLAPELIVGPPHRIMALPWQCRLLFFLVIAFGRPVQLLSPAYVAKAKKSRRGTSAWDRYTHLRWKMLRVPQSQLQKMNQTFMQTDSLQEVKSRDGIKNTSIPIMQFQGEDEFAVHKPGVLVSDQPYFGTYNLFRNEVEDLYPGMHGQDATALRSDLLTKQAHYKLLQLKPGARMSRFALIPESAHFNVVENPLACATAINDFVSDQA